MASVFSAAAAAAAAFGAQVCPLLLLLLLLLTKVQVVMSHLRLSQVQLLIFLLNSNF